HEMLSGQRPFGGDTAADVMSGILREDPPALPVEQRHIPPGLERIVRRCLEKNPVARFQSARDLAFALEALTAPTSSVSAVISEASPSRNRVVALPVAGLAAVILALLAAGTAWMLK